MKKLAICSITAFILAAPSAYAGGTPGTTITSHDNITINGNFSSPGDITISTPGTVTINGNITTPGNLTINAGGINPNIPSNNPWELSPNIQLFDNQPVVTNVTAIHLSADNGVNGKAIGQYASAAAHIQGIDAEKLAYYASLSPSAGRNDDLEPEQLANVELLKLGLLGF